MEIPLTTKISQNNEKTFKYFFDCIVWLLLKYDFPEEYDIEFIDDDEIGGIIDSKKLIVDLTEDSIYLSFRKNKKSQSFLNILVNSIQKVEPFIHTKGRFIKKDSPAIEMSFEQVTVGDRMQKTIRFYIEKESINVFIDHINYLKEAEVNPAYKKQIRIYLNPYLCTEYFTNRAKTLTFLCENCNLKIHGNVILQNKSAEYHGGHKAYPSGGTFRKHENGQLFLNEKSLVFVKDKKDEEKRIDIIIPFSSIGIGGYGIADENTSGVIGGGGGVSRQKMLMSW